MTAVGKTCLVIMGFGKKTHHESGRTLDLDATYEAIIRPAVVDSGCQCYRADEIQHSGVIDEKLYEMLLNADLVVADISTGNLNAVYELGVRHALRPYSTIIMAEDETELQFDLNHINTFRYSHLGADIGFREASRATQELKKLITSIMNSPRTDSPVYTCIQGLKFPEITDEEFRERLDSMKESEENFLKLKSKAESASSRSDHRNAANNYNLLLEIKPHDVYIRQQAAFHTYKSKHPSELEALMTAREILNQLHPESTNDPETLGLCGAIHKRIWDLEADLDVLDSAIKYYEKGYVVSENYYNGENAATLLELRSKLHDDQDEAHFDRIYANKIRLRIIEKLSLVISDAQFEERSDQIWVFATLANCLFAVSRDEEAEQFERKFLNLSPLEWQRETYFLGKKRIFKILRNSTID